jgi:hypothetical protein
MFGSHVFLYEADRMLASAISQQLLSSARCVEGGGSTPAGERAQLAGAMLIKVVAIAGVPIVRGASSRCAVRIVSIAVSFLTRQSGK